jgi:hypothetical protein
VKPVPIRLINVDGSLRAVEIKSKLKLSPADQRRLRKEVLEFAEGIASANRLRFMRSGPAEQAKRLARLIAAIQSTVKSLSALKSMPGQKVASKAFDWPIVQRLQEKQMIREWKSNTRRREQHEGSGGYPAQTIIDLETLLEDVKAVLHDVKPRPGNASDRAPRNKTKREIARHFVVQCFTRYRGLPPACKDSWADTMLTGVFEEVGLGSANAALWIERKSVDLREAYQDAAPTLEVSTRRPAKLSK